MKRPRTLKQAVRQRIARKRVNVFLRADFEDIGGYDQIGRILRGLVSEGVLIKIGYGLYARTKVSALNGDLVPIQPLPVLAREALTRLNIPVLLTKSEVQYRDNQSTQVPTGRRIGVQGRIIRKIAIQNAEVMYEHVSR
jgi:Family of unknown function (DUF6088)